MLGTTKGWGNRRAELVLKIIEKEECTYDPIDRSDPVQLALHTYIAERLLAGLVLADVRSLTGVGTVVDRQCRTLNELLATSCPVTLVWSKKGRKEEHHRISWFWVFITVRRYLFVSMGLGIPLFVCSCL